MPALRLQLYKKAITPSYKILHPEQNKMYEEALSFDGGLAFATAEELTIKKVNGSIFRTPLCHYESDYMTETYVGEILGEPFRFVFASDSNPTAFWDPMVTFGSMSSSGWAVHYRVHP